jgi:hypothetical protein
LGIAAPLPDFPQCRCHGPVEVLLSVNKMDNRSQRLYFACPLRHGSLALILLSGAQFQ